MCRTSERVGSRMCMEPWTRNVHFCNNLVTRSSLSSGICPSLVEGRGLDCPTWTLCTLGWTLCTGTRVYMPILQGRGSLVIHTNGGYTVYPPPENLCRAVAKNGLPIMGKCSRHHIYFGAHTSTPPLYTVCSTHSVPLDSSTPLPSVPYTASVPVHTLYA